MKKQIKSIYKLIPFKKHIFSLIKKIYKPSKNIYQHLHFEGSFKVDISKTKSFQLQHYGFQVENEIFWNGLFSGWEAKSLEIWAKLCQNAQVIIDIGANTGIYALVAKTTQPNAKVYAFEPVKRVFEKLQYNVKLNNFDIQCVQKGVSNQDGFATIYDIDEVHTYSVTVNKNIHNPNRSVIPTSIEICTLDSFANQNRLLVIDLLKIDVETHEPEVLEGMKMILQKHQAHYAYRST